MMILTQMISQYQLVKQNKIMDNLDIQASLRKLDKRLLQQLSGQEKKSAIKQFKKLYAQQMSKIAGQLSKKVKVQQNLNFINQREIEDARQIDQELKKKMEKVQQNREKVMGSKQKQYKMLEQNWKRRFQQITRKNRMKERQAFRKAQKMRKDVEQYWHKKGQTLNLRQSSAKKDKHNTTFNPYGSSAKERQLTHGKQIKTQYSQPKKMSQKLNLPHVTKSKINRVDFGSRSMNRSVAQSTLNQEIKEHQERSLKEAKEEQADKIHKYLEKLQKIQRTRKIAQDRIEKEVKEAKRLRELRQNPQTLAANRKRSTEQLHKSKQRSIRKEGSRAQLSNSHSKSKKDLDASIYQHLESKKRLQQQQFYERQINFQQSKQKIKQTKINRLIKQAISMLKHQTMTDQIE